MTNIEIAHELFFGFLEETFKNLWKNPQFEHSDKSGYWFTFELKNDARRQTWCIRPNEVLEFLKDRRAHL